MKNDSIVAKLARIQNKLNVPKDLYNKFGGFNYRSAEGILKEVKKLAFDEGCVVVLDDEIKEIGGRVYVKSTATLAECKDDGKEIHATAYACEPNEKKGMDSSQITGASSSYARKYALCALFAIDDGVDNDNFDNRKENGQRRPSNQDSFKVDFKAVRTKIAQCTTQAQLEELWHTLEDPATGKVPAYVDKYLKEAFTKRKEEI